MTQRFSSYLSNSELISLIGERVRQSRIDQELTQSELAEKSGITAKTIKSIESGLPVNLLTFLAITRALGFIENLNLLIPEPQPTIKDLKEIRSAEHVRQRVRKSKFTHA